MKKRMTELESAILDLTLHQCLPIFTSKEFGALARKNGASDKLVKNGFTAGYLKAKCEKVSQRTWKKKTIVEKAIQTQPKQEKLFEEQPKTLNNEMAISQAIFLLKKHGYKILKPETQFKEI